MDKKFKYVGRFCEGLAPASDGKKWGFINLRKEVVIPFQFDWTNDFCNGIAPIQVNRAYGWINKEGQIVVRPKYSDACNVFGVPRIANGIKMGKLNPETLEEIWD